LNLAGEALLHVLAQIVVGGQLGGLRPARDQLGLPLRDRCAVLERAAALRRSSREIVDGERSSCLAISYTRAPCARSSAISSRSSKHKYLHETSSSTNVAIPPRSQNHRTPAAVDTPTACAASTLLKPSLIRRQNARSMSRRCDACPGTFIGDRPVSSFIHPAGRPIATPFDQVLRRPRESADPATSEFAIDLGFGSTMKVRVHVPQVEIVKCIRPANERES
jgi:hypothetical protein